MRKLVLITGATSGFGEACAHLFAANNYNIIINGRRQDRLDALSDELSSKHGIDVYKAPFDVQNRTAVFEAIAALPEEWQNIDVLINNAGLALGRDLFDEG